MKAEWNTLTEKVTHRPWELPDRPWIMTMRWSDLLFAHWRVPIEVIADLLPEPFEVDTFKGEAWVGIVPFVMEKTGPRGCPDFLKWRFAELNVRTYVRCHGKPGVWFFSLDTSNPLAVIGARTAFHLPYYHADMHVVHGENEVIYSSERKDRKLGPGEFRGSYRGVGEVYHSIPGSLEHWLTERYCLWTVNRAGTPCVGEIHHAQWPLQKAEADLEINTVAEAHGLTLPEEAPLLHYAAGVDVLGWPLTKAKQPAFSFGTALSAGALGFHERGRGQ